MDTTYEATDSLVPYPTRVHRRWTAADVAWWALVSLVTLASVLLLGACFLQLTGLDLSVRWSPVVARGLAAFVALLVAVIIPLRAEQNSRLRWQKVNPFARFGRRGFSLLAVNLTLPVLLALTAPDFTRAALTNHGEWVVRGLPRAEAVMHHGAARVASWIPRHTPLTLTNQTSWTAPTASGRCECR